MEGVRLVEEALRSACPIEAVLFSEGGERYRERLAPLIARPEIAFPVLRTTDRLFEGLADTEHPQGVAALVQPRATTFDEVVRTPAEACSPLLLVLAGGCRTPEMSAPFCAPPRLLARGGGYRGIRTKRHR